MAAQLTLMSGMSRCALRSWMARAASSLPVPVSPVMSTVLLRLRDQLELADQLLDGAAAPDDAVVVELLVALATAGSGAACAAAGARARAARPPAARPPRTASAGSRRRPASWPRSRSRRWRGRSSSRSAAARPRACAAASSRIISRPVRSGMRLSTTSRSNDRAPPAGAAPRAALVAATTSWPSSRRARPSVLRMPSSSSTSRMEPRGAIIGSRRAGAAGSSIARDRRPRPAGSRAAIGAAERLHDVLGDGQAEAGAGALGREVGLEDVRQVLGGDAVPRSSHLDRPRGRPPDAARSRRTDRARRRPARPPAAHRLAALRQDVDEHGAQALGVGDDGGQPGSERRIRQRAAPSPRQRGGRGVAAERVEVGRARTPARTGRAKSSTSPTMRFRRATSWSMSAAASAHVRRRQRSPGAASAARP